MSSIDINFKTNSNRKFIEKIVQQGQRLRNAMVEALLSYDPFNKEILLNNPNNSLTVNIKGDPSIAQEKQCQCDNDQYKKSDILNYSKIEKYLNGDDMKPNEESQALEILRSMSLNNILRPTTSGLYKGCCDLCEEYENRLFCAGSTKVVEPNLSHFKRKDKAKAIRKKDKHDLLQYVDSLRVQVYSLRLNSAGCRKASEDEGSTRFTTSKTYCVEYCLPADLKRPTVKSGARVDSGLQSDKVVRLCSRNERDGSVYFKQRSVHPVRNLSGLSLAGVRLLFKLGWRRVGQRSWHSVGVAEADLAALISAHSLSLEQELTIIGDGAPVVLGTMKVSLQFGCDGLYFGREFVDAMSCSKENVNLSETDSIFRMSDSEQNEAESTAKTLKVSNPIECDKSSGNTDKRKDKVDMKRAEKSTEVLSCADDCVSADVRNESELLHLLVKVLDARILSSNQSDVYLVSHGLSGDDVSVSRFVCLSENRLTFNFRQLIAVQYNDKLLDRLRDNFIVLEVRQRDRLLGIVKLSVHKLYLTYRNPAIVKLVLAQNSDATVVIDGWEPITDPISGQIIGELRSVVALGTRQQIENLELGCAHPNLAEYESDEQPQQKPGQALDALVTEKADACTQFEPPAMDHTKPSNDFLSCFLEQLIELNQRTAKMVETSTNTDPNERDEKNGEPQPVVRNTSELLDTLHQALLIPDANQAQQGGDQAAERKPAQDVNAEMYFKAHVVVESALHLPGSGGRRRCRSRRNKSRSANEALPSTYVTFQARADARCEATPVVMWSSSPRWDYRRDVRLPADLLQHSNKRLIFRVWRTTGAAGAKPDPRSDIVIGFAALDLTVLLSGLPGIHGWFNIVDFANKCNGQIKIHVTPMESLARFAKSVRVGSEGGHRPVGPAPIAPPPPPSDDNIPTELLSRALKRKFTELDEITQRLKQRLSAVTDADSDDDFADEFERDLNTVCTEPDLPVSSRESEEPPTPPAEPARVASTQPECRLSELDQHLAQGKLKIDSLLEKLSLLGTEGEARVAAATATAPFTGRYVSGCSVHEAEERLDSSESENALKDLGLDAHEDIDPDLIFNPLLFQQMFAASVETTPRLVQCATLSEFVSETGDGRRAPDGAGV